ncbi:hypothetical protein V5H41_29645, partial [Salmonella enterica]
FDYQPWFIQKAGQWQQVQLESWKAPQSGSDHQAESIFDYQPWFIQKAGQWQQVQLESWKAPQSGSDHQA